MDLLVQLPLCSRLHGSHKANTFQKYLRKLTGKSQNLTRSLQVHLNNSGLVDQNQSFFRRFYKVKKHWIKGRLNQKLIHYWSVNASSVQPRTLHTKAMRSINSIVRHIKTQSTYMCSKCYIQVVNCLRLFCESLNFHSMSPFKKTIILTKYE